ncbi:MAG: baseplate J/gp47 family protein [Thermoleophilia bacterium]
MATPRSRTDLAREWIRRLVGYSPSVSWFGSGGVALAFSKATGDLAEIAQDLFVSMRRRLTLLASSESDLDDIAQELGTARLTDARAHVYAVVVPWSASVVAVVSAGNDFLQVDDASRFLALDSLRIRGSSGTSEALVVIAIVGNVIECLPLTGTYNPLTEGVSVLLRTTIPVGSTIVSQAGVSFQTLATVIAGDANPLFDGEAAFVALADKVDCECSVAGAAGNIEPDSLDSITGAPRIARVYNPEGGYGGDSEQDAQLKYRASHRATLANQETSAWLFALAREGNPNTLRAIKDTTTALSTLKFRLLKRTGASFSAAELTELKAYMEARFRSQYQADIGNVTLTAITVEARVKMSSGASFQTSWRAAASGMAAYLDYRVWAFGGTVDNSELLQILQNTAGIASVETASFLPAVPVPVSALSLPVLVYFAIEDQDTGETFGGNLAVSF